MEQQYTCVLCNEQNKGYGNNPEPLASEGECCNDCNIKVILARFITTPSQGDEDDEEEEEDEEEEDEDEKIQCQGCSEDFNDNELNTHESHGGYCDECNGEFIYSKLCHCSMCEDVRGDDCDDDDEE